MIQIVKNQLDVEVFRSIRTTAGFYDYENQDIEYAIQHSLYTTVAYAGDIPVGMGRIVGDGRISFFIKDVVTIPEYQQQGIGTMIMNSLLDYIKDHAVHHSYIGLMSTVGKEEFYEKFGFIRRPNAQYGSGMIRYYEKV